MTERLECSHPCGGTCCRDFVLTVSPDRIPGYIEAARARIAEGTANEYERDAVWWLPHIHANGTATTAGTATRYHCDLLDAAGRCSVYATRPRTCREYPSSIDGGKCAACGFVAPRPAPDPELAKVLKEFVQLTKAPSAT